MIRPKNSSLVRLTCRTILGCIVIVGSSDGGQASSKVGGIVKDTPVGPRALSAPARLVHLDPERYLRKLRAEGGELVAPLPRIGVSKGGKNMFNPNPVSISDTSTATIDISASVGCSDPNCLSDGDYVMVEIIQDSLGGNFSYRPGNTSEGSQTQTVQLKLGDAVTASFQVTAKKGTPAQQYNFIIRVSDVRRGDTSILQNVVLDPPTGGVEERLTVTQ